MKSSRRQGYLLESLLMAHPLYSDARHVKRVLEAEYGKKVPYMWCLNAVQKSLITASTHAKQNRRPVQDVLVELIREDARARA